MEQEVCPNCGEYTDYINSWTGWCASCSGLDLCANCGKPFAKDRNRTRCSTCRKNDWLEKNADEIEDYMSNGLSLIDAKAQVQIDNTIFCLNCGDPVNSGHAGQALFCAKEECRKVYNRYTWQRKKGLTKEDVLRKALANGY